MNTYCQKIAAEMSRLKNEGAEIPERIIELVVDGGHELGAMAVDRLRDEFDTSELYRLTTLASRERHPEYWEKVDRLGGFRDGPQDYCHNVRVTAGLLSNT